MTLLLYFDEDAMRRDVQSELRRRGWDCLSTSEVSNRRQSDEQQLRWATEAGRCVVTSNQGDFARLHREWLAIGQHHAGIIITEQRLGPGVIVRAFEALAEKLDSSSIGDQIVFLSNWA